MKKLNIFLIFVLSSLFLFASTPKKEVVKGETLINLKESLTKQTVNSVVTPIKKESSLNLKEVFIASPIIYSILFLMSIASLVILLFTLFTFKSKDLISKKTVEDLKEYLLNENYEDALSYCKSKKCLLSFMIASGINSRKHGTQHLIGTIKASGKRKTSCFWQRISLLNDIVIIAPMLGLLGTVIGMFYAFYDINRSIDSLSALFDGLGIAVGTTVAGLIVAIIAMVFYATLKYKMIKSLNTVENEATALGNLIKTKE